jgi:hypothetical protein
MFELLGTAGQMLTWPGIQLFSKAGKKYIFAFTDNVRILWLSYKSPRQLQGLS